MLYLEDYLEMIEHLPQELRDRFTEMRELDLTVQNSVDSLEKTTRTFFQQCKRGELDAEPAESEFINLRKEYYKVLEDADEKVAIATQIHDLVERYLRRLDSELFKFKCELEADNNGITEILEKRSLELDGSTSATALVNMAVMNQKENRYFGAMSAGSMGLSSNSHGLLSGAVVGISTAPVVNTPPIPTKETQRYRIPKTEKRRESMSTYLPEKRLNLGNNSLTQGTSTPVSVMRPITPAGISGHTILNTATPVSATPSTAVTYNLQQLSNAASNAIAAAASQAIVATQQMQQGRRTASLKASYEAIHGSGGAPTEFWISRDITNPPTSTNVVQNTLLVSGTERKQKKKLNTVQHSVTLASCASTHSSPISLNSCSSTINIESIEGLSSSPSMVGSISLSSLGLTNVSTTGSTSSGSTNRVVAGISTVVTTNVLPPTTNLTLNDSTVVVEQTTEGDWSYDPNEPRYCTCNQVSYGDMVACDNDACPYEWFHYPCVGITQPPKGKWYCPKCTASMRRRHRKN